MRPRQATILASAAVVVAATACAAETGPPVLTWYINPDDGGQAELAAQCTDESGGDYRITTSLLPRDAPGQREQLARRLAAGDTGIDIMSLDPPFIPEFAEAGWLAELPPDVAEAAADGVLESAVQASTWRDELVAVPFWANTQLLWYRTSVAESAGLDPENEAVTWEQLIEAAQSEDTYLAVQGVREEALTVWINALVASADGVIIENPEAPADEVQLGLESEAGEQAAEIIGTIARDGLGGPGLSGQDEEASMRLFQGDAAAFMVNWPFVWAATQAAVDEGALDQEWLDDVGWALYPAVSEDEPARPPYGGISLGVSAFSEHVDEALDAIECIVQPENQAFYFVNDGNPPSHPDAYDDAEVQEAFPMADVIQDSLEQAAPRPQTPYYNEVSEGIQTTWHPPASVSPDTSPAAATTLITEVLRGERLL